MLPLMHVKKVGGPWLRNLNATHGTGICAYIWHKFMVNVGKYSMIDVFFCTDISG